MHPSESLQDTFFTNWGHTQFKSCKHNLLKALRTLDASNGMLVGRDSSMVVGSTIAMDSVSGGNLVVAAQNQNQKPVADSAQERTCSQHTQKHNADCEARS